MWHAELCTNMHQKLNILTISAAAVLLIAPPVGRAQEAPTTTITEPVEKSDREFLNNLEQSDGAKPAPGRAVSPSPKSAPAKVQAAKSDLPTKPIAAVKKSPDPKKKAKREREGSSKAEEVASDTKPVPAETTTTTTTATLAEVPDEESPAEDNGFFHRLFAHLHHLNQ